MQLKLWLQRCRIPHQDLLRVVPVNAGWLDDLANSATKTSSEALSYCEVYALGSQVKHMEEGSSNERDEASSPDNYLLGDDNLQSQDGATYQQSW